MFLIKAKMGWLPNYWNVFLFEKDVKNNKKIPFWGSKLSFLISKWNNRGNLLTVNHLFEIDYWLIYSSLLYICKKRNSVSFSNHIKLKTKNLTQINSLLFSRIVVFVYIIWINRIANKLHIFLEKWKMPKWLVSIALNVYKN